VVTPSGLVVLTDRRLVHPPVDRRPPVASGGGERRSPGSAGAGGAQDGSARLVSVVAAAVRGGASWVILRERDLPADARLALAAALRELLPPGRLIVAGPDPLGGSAVHLAAADPKPPGVPLIGRSCHEPVDPSDADYVTLSPIFPTSSKPGYGPPLDPSRAASMAGEVPWLALGGIDTPSRVAECMAAGAAGIAVMGAVMRSPDPERTTRDLATAAATQAVGHG
jgi:thiamine-phosphate pyrophosphorylase